MDGEATYIFTRPVRYLPPSTGNCTHNPDGEKEAQRRRQAPYPIPPLSLAPMSSGERILAIHRQPFGVPIQRDKKQKPSCTP